MRAAVSQRRWLGWVAQQANNSTRSSARQQAGSSGGQTIKNALIRGYRIEPLEEPIAKAWVEKWRSLVRQYRGEPDARGPSAEHATAVKVKVSSLQGFLQRIEAGFGKGRQVLPQSADPTRNASDFEVLFGIRVESGERDLVEVWVDERTNESLLPQVDLLKEGCCGAALWELRNGRWETIQIWL